MSKKLSVVIGRFQVPSLTMGHSRLLTTAKTHGDHVLVLIGSPGKPPSVSNPLDYLMREKMIRQALPWATIMPVWDDPDDQKWIQTVEELTESVRVIQRLDSIVYYTDHDGFVKYCMPKNGDVVYESPQKYDEERGTSVRQRTGKLIEHSTDFRSMGKNKRRADRGNRPETGADLRTHFWRSGAPGSNFSVISEFRNAWRDYRAAVARARAERNLTEHPELKPR